MIPTASIRTSLLASLIMVMSCSKGDSPAPVTPPPPPPAPKAPTIASLSVPSGHPDTEVTISGTDFGGTAAANEVKFNGVAAEVSSATTTKLVVKVPVLAGTGAVTVKTSAGSATGPSFEYLPDTLLAGTEFNRITNGSVAKYWKNGLGIPLFDSTKVSVCTDMVMAGPDVYAVGYQWNGTANVAMLWKNGTQTMLTDGTHDAHARQVKVVGNDVYVVGYEKNDNYTVAKYWKNGAATTLSNGASNAEAFDIAVSGSDVYVVGGEYSFSTLVGVAMVWKNGVPTALSSGQQDATATQVAISGTDVLIAGVREPFVGSGTEESVLWKNGIMNSLSNGRSGWASQLVVSHGDVYVAGIHDDRRANYWKNGQEVFLNDGTNIAYVNGLLVSGSDVYGVGEEFVNDHAVGRIWKNGTPISLDNVNNDVYLYRMVIR